MPTSSGTIPFQPLTAFIPALAAGFSYTCKDDTDALNRLQKIFEDIRRDETGGFLFFKMQDVHQMQESTERLPEGLTPGGTHFSPREERQGLGGDFVSPPGQVIYQGTETWAGLRAGYVKAIALGLRFKTGPLTVYTNFFYTLHVGLEGAFQGLLLYGEGQETATVFNKNAKTGANKPTAVLQRQFSIRHVR